MNRQIAPEIKTISKLITGFPEKTKNFYQLVSEEGVFKLEIIFPNAGYGLIDNKFHGIFGMDLLLSGTHDKNSDEIANKIDELGGYVFKECDYYNSSVTIFGMNENILKLIEIVKNSWTNCLYSSKELEVYKSRKISELNININKTNYLANRSINKLLLGDKHPYSYSSSETLINEIQRDDLINFNKKHLVKPYFIFTGSDQTQIENILIHSGFEIYDLMFPENKPNPEIPETLKEEFILKSGSTQNSLRLGKILPSRDHSDYFTISLVNLILGGYFGSRLMKNIREEKGLTYGIHSSITPFKNFSLFKISSECNNILTEQVKNEIHKEILRLQTELIDDEEFITAKNYLLGALSRNFDGAFNISERFKSFLELDSDKDFYNRYFKAIIGTTREQIMECANNYFNINSFKYCVAGEL